MLTWTNQETLFRVEKLTLRGRYVQVAGGLEYPEANRMAREIVAKGQTSFACVRYGQNQAFVAAYQAKDGKVVEW